MKGGAAVSVVVASRGRGRELARCLDGLAQQDHPSFEVVVVGDESAMAAARGRPVKAIAFAQPNLSASRNLGLCHAGGEIAAFIDDDAVPLPGWLSALAAPFSDPSVMAAGGQVLQDGSGRREWLAGTVDCEGLVTPMTVPEDRTSLHRGGPGRAIAVLGTNMAFRRDRLAALGGFDPAFRYFLDETDLCMRMAGEVFAVVPGACVVHRSAESGIRGPGRRLRDLVEIGASHGVYLRKHCSPSESESARLRFARVIRGRVLHQMVNGLLEPREIVPLLETLSAGFREGMCREIAPLPRLGPARSPFRRHPPAASGPRVLVGWPWQARGLARQARQLAARGEPVLVRMRGIAAPFHRIGFTKGGFWLQLGGARACPTKGSPLFPRASFGKAFAEELRNWSEDGLKT